MTTRVAWQTEALIARGEEAQAADDYAVAQDCFAKALLTLPGHRPTRFNLAVSLLRLGDFDQAAVLLDALVRELPPTKRPGLRLPVLYNAALAEAGVGRNETALEYARSLVRETSGGLTRWPRRREDADVLARLEGPAVALLATLLSRAQTRPADPEMAPLDRGQLLMRLESASWRTDLSPAALATFARGEHGLDPRTRYELARYQASTEFGVSRPDLEIPPETGLPVENWSDGDPLLRPVARPPREADRIIDAAAEEVRLVIAMDGGFRRGAWSGGCVVELDAARRAHREPQDQAAPRLYRHLAQAFQREVVLDIFTATSAATINAALLAHTQLPLTPRFVRELWLKLADASSLLTPSADRAPRAVAQNIPLADALENVFCDLRDAGAESFDAVLDVTVAVVAPDEDPIAHALQARRSKRIRFRLGRQDATPQALAQLATAAASQPLAFSAWQLDRAVLSLTDAVDATHFADAGQLGAADLRAALDIIPTRPANRVVARYLCVVGDSPTDIDLTTDATASVLALTALDSTALKAAAEALFSTYRDRRVRSSLAELGARQRPALDDPELPWIPQSASALNAGEWGWGVRPAQRIGHLLLDLLRVQLASANATERARLLGVRAQLETELSALEPLTRIDPGQSLFDVIDQAERYDIRTKVDRMITAAEHGGILPPHDSQADAATSWLERLLAIEVLRRANGQAPVIDSGQPISQLSITPFASTVLLSSRPWSAGEGPASPAEKLTGDHAGHFSHRAWRVNDFMWGRLDAVAPIVDMFVSGERARLLDDDGVSDKPWDVLASALAPSSDGLAHQLVTEALQDAPAGYPSDLASAIKHDLLVADERCRLTRILCTRAAQLEILREEWPELEAESSRDAAVGRDFPPLALGPDDASALRSLRLWPTLPQRLVVADGVDRLTLRTDLRAALIAVSVLRRARTPFAWAIDAVGALLAPASAVLAHPDVAFITYWSAALFLSARVVSTPEVGSATFGGMFVALVAALVIAGVASVPGLLAAGAHGRRRWRHCLLAVALVAAGGGAAGLLAVTAGGLTLAQLIAAPGASGPPDAITLLLSVLLVGTALGVVERPMPRWFRGVFGVATGRALTTVSALAVAATSFDALGAAVGDEAWKTLSVLVAAAGPPSAAVLANLFRLPSRWAPGSRAATKRLRAE